LIREMILSQQTLTEFGRNILSAVGVSPAKAELVVTSLVAASLRGVDSHGIQLLPFYVGQIEAGNINIQTDGRVVSESGGCLVYDGEYGIGQWIAAASCDHAIRLAKANGISYVVARDSSHFGAAAFWGQRLSSAGLVGIVMCNASPLVPPWQGKEKRFGTNPICVSVPGPDTWLLDMATTTVAMGKIFKAQLSNQATIPAGWAMDSEGVPTTDTQAARDGLLMPLGGYKGSGLAMLAEILCGVLGGGAMSTELGGIYTRNKPMRVSQCFIGIEVARFMPEQQFEERLRSLRDLVKSAAPAKGYDEVLVAGEPEWRNEERRRVEGIPISDGTWQALTEIAERYRIPIPG
jgi:LDH2 family malate/lactate/ureidoglycolate dehydrogenase